MADHQSLSDLPRQSTAIAESPAPTLAEICGSPDDFLGKRDVGELNLRCAAGLPGAENLDVAEHVSPA